MSHLISPCSFFFFYLDVGFFLPSLLSPFSIFIYFLCVFVPPYFLEIEIPQHLLLERNNTPKCPRFSGREFLQYQWLSVERRPFGINIVLDGVVRISGCEASFLFLPQTHVWERKKKNMASESKFLYQNGFTGIFLLLRLYIHMETVG